MEPSPPPPDAPPPATAATAAATAAAAAELAATPRPAPSLSLPARVVYTFGAPGCVGASLAAHPRSAGAFVLCILLALASALPFYLTPQGKKLSLAAVEKATAKQAAAAHDAPAAPPDAVEKMWPFIVAFGLGGAVVGTPIVLLLVAALLWLIFRVFLGSELTFRHAFAVAAHGALISSLGAALHAALVLVRGTQRATLSLAAFVLAAPERSPTVLALGLFDFFTVWWLIATGILVGRAGRLPPGRAVGLLLVLYFVIGGAVVGIQLLLAGSPLGG